MANTVLAGRLKCVSNYETQASAATCQEEEKKSWNFIVRPHICITVFITLNQPHDQNN